MTSRHALNGVTLWAEQVESENKEEVRSFLRRFRAVYGGPLRWMQDPPARSREAWNEEFPGVPPKEDQLSTFRPN
ncbi:MAG: hypothetical protein ACREC5_03795 [Thermoplasmata archaeon]